MVLGPVSRYSLVNAKVRARLSTLLSPETIARLAETKEPSEFYSALGGTPYEKILSTPEVSFDPRVAEKLFVEQEIEWHIELERELKGSASNLIAHFLEKYEIENVKTALRIREGSRDLSELNYIIRKGMPHSIDYQAIAEARSIEDAIALLVGTKYQAPLKGAIAGYTERGTLFPLEIALEVDFYKRLKDLVSVLPKPDREIARRLIGLEIDQKNLAWLIRLKFYYDIPTGDLLAYNIPGGYRLNESRLRQSLMGDSVKDVLTAALDKGFKSASEFIRHEEELGKLYLLEIILWSNLVREARRTLGGFPFTIGTVLAYLILKRTEIRNLITILNGKAYRMNREAIEGHLRTMF